MTTGTASGSSHAESEHHRVGEGRRLGLGSAKRALRKLAWLVPLVVAAVLVGRWYLVPVPVVATAVARGDMITEVFGRGTLESCNEVELGFDVVGRIQELAVDEGDSVVTGQVLARLDLGQLSAEHQAAQGTVAVARAALVRLAAEERKAEASLSFAEVEAQRAAALQERGAIATRELDAAVERLRYDRAELERIRAARKEATQQILAAGTGVEVRSAATARGILVAPFDGRIVRRLREPGDIVSVGTSVFRVIAQDSMRARARIDDSALPTLAVGQKARVRLGSPGAPYATGHIDRIGHEVDRQTHEVWVEVLLPELPAWAALGQRVDVWIETSRTPERLQIPSKFVKWDGADAYAYVGQDGRIERVPISLGADGVQFVEVQGGLTEADVILDSPDSSGQLATGRRFAVKQ